MELKEIKVNCISNDSFTAIELNHQKDLPKSASIYKCGQEENFGRSFTLYRKISKRGNKMYIIFSKYF
jgi:hypothetical protein